MIGISLTPKLLEDCFPSCSHLSRDFINAETLIGSLKLARRFSPTLYLAERIASRLLPRIDSYTSNCLYNNAKTANALCASCASFIYLTVLHSVEINLVTFRFQLD